jgi:hypothetical protein
VTPAYHIIRPSDGDEFYAFKTHLNIYRLGDATLTLSKDSKAVYSAVEWNDIGSTACTLASTDTPIYSTSQALRNHITDHDNFRMTPTPLPFESMGYHSFIEGSRYREGPEILPFCEYCQKGKETRKTPAPRATRLGPSQ